MPHALVKVKRTKEKMHPVKMETITVEIFGMENPPYTEK